MSFEARRQWTYGLVALVVPSAYLVWLLQQIGAATAVADISYFRPLLWAIGAGIVGNIVLEAFVRGGGKNADRKDPRDHDIDRRGDQWSFVVFSVLVLVPFALALADQSTFWIANTIYFAYTLTALIGVVIKSVLHHRGVAA